MLRVGARTPGRPRIWLLAILALYAVLLAASPLLHHDVACHFKSPTHCTGCTASPHASRIDAGPPLPAQSLPDAGLVVSERPESVRTAQRFALSGRSPPA
jgi:hypothetical protein